MTDPINTEQQARRLRHDAILAEVAEEEAEAAAVEIAGRHSAPDSATCLPTGRDHSA